MKKAFLLSVCLSVGSMPVHADIIYFRDGMRTICQEKAWEENGEIKCEYDGVVLSYSKTDVLRIEQIKSNPPPTSPIPIQTLSKTALPKAVAPLKATTTGVLFYDPRRPQKYWSSASAKHNTFEEAVAALAAQYERSPQWVQQHLGNTNDLDEIHKNLTDHKSFEDSHQNTD